MELQIEIRRFQRGALKAFADVKFIFGETDLTVPGFRVIQRNGAPPWVGLPSSSYTNRDGKLVNKPVIEMGRGLQKTVTEAILVQHASQIDWSVELPARPQRV